MTALMYESGMAAIASVLAAVCGTCLGWSWMQWRVSHVRKQRLKQVAGSASGTSADGLRPRVVTFAIDISRRLSLQALSCGIPPVWQKKASSWLSRYARKAGLEDELSAAGFCEASLRLALTCGGVAAVGGMVFSTELALVGGLAGAVWGLTALPRAIKQLIRKRAETLERDLSEMLEVVSLGLRSGLAFDRSFELYGAHFHSELSRTCTSAKRAWTLGLVTREQALRDVASSYDSLLLARVVEGMVRSLRFGSSLADNLEAFAVEARAVHRARVEEAVAKAPVKMMLPTGALILPAMLLLVLGPVLLELMEGF